MLKTDFAAAYEEVRSVRCLGTRAHRREHLSSLPWVALTGVAGSPGSGPLTWA